MLLSVAKKIIPKWAALYTVQFYTGDSANDVIASSNRDEKTDISLAVFNVTLDDIKGDTEGLIKKNDVKIYQLKPTGIPEQAFYPLSTKSWFDWLDNTYEIQPSSQRPNGEFTIYIGKLKNATS